ncbi:Hsp33 family molecular chaperone HslO [Desnuesiella massiliensis]|uniref:Hsp33 family molecular chaperone HslO n=1 Tax=Desnuesiella massiliensis TaxID=1650662 RepID=UPI0006E41DA8|nr:Hsp33 family molecular chaperone HslO [Desnuesiella massiliensis]
MKKNLVKLLTKDKEIRLFIIDATNILERSNLKNMKTDFARQLYTNIFIDCCLLRGFLTEVDQRISVSVRFKPAGHTAHCDVDGSGNVNCTFSSQLAAFNGDFADLVGDGASLSISRASWMSGIFTGTVELKSASINSCFSYFYSKSEQTKTIFRTWIENGIARGCLIQPLPFYNINHLHFVMDSIYSAEKYMITEQWAELTIRVFPYATVVDEYIVQSECNCSKEMFFGILMSVETDELKNSIEVGKNEELECGICGKRYIFSTNDLEAIVKIKESEQDG